MLPAMHEVRILEEAGCESPKCDSNLLTPPGGFLVWVIFFVEFLTFGVGLVVFEVLRRQEPEVFQVG